MSSILRLEGVQKNFGETTAVANFSLEIAPGELITLRGPSGCGKTTTLRMIAGFETPTSGRILLDGQEITRMPPQRRGFGMVFQNYALFPHLDVFENVAFGLKGRGLPRGEIASRVDEALALVDLGGYGRRKIQQLSGGQQQRVALARALAPEPRILLLDEPLSNLDATLRERTRAELRSLVERLGITAIFVTHDQEEAFELSDRIAIMEGGRLQQVGSPEELYLEPANPFVASFLGRANFLEGRVVERDGSRLICEMPGGARWQVRVAGDNTGKGVGDQPWRESPEAGLSTSGTPKNYEERVRIMVRPELLTLLSPSDPHPEELAATLPGTIVERRFGGPTTLYQVRIGTDEVSVVAERDAGRPGAAVRLALRPDAVPLAFTTVALLPKDPDPEETVRV
jgi:iron(III) transport system ATP-binding protein